jgi:deferrochelatase/peroxidase EfeB
MAVDLGATLSWTNAGGDDRDLLDALQPNILKPHIRTHLTVLLLQFTNAGSGKEFLRNLLQAAPPILKSAQAQLVEAQRFNARTGFGTPYVGVGLSHSGYVRLGAADDRVPRDKAFVRGMRNKVTRTRLGDGPLTGWDKPYRKAVHAIVLIGAAAAGDVEAVAARIGSLRPAGVIEVGSEHGQALHSAEGWAVEHFGFRDGISDPIFLEEDAVRAEQRLGGPARWNPSLPLGRVLVPGPTGDPKHFGSYLVYRKLEQNVRAFEQACRALAGTPNPSPATIARAGALLVGRYPDGTSAQYAAPGVPVNELNNFSYVDDLGGRRCPLPAHVRKTNPRGSSVEFLTERRHLMARRGQTYGERPPAAPGIPQEPPETGVGLLFMALNADIGEQFEFVQQQWANSEIRPIANNQRTRGMDQIIGAGRRTELRLPAWPGGQGWTDVPPIPEVVTLKGGEYFFLPSWPTLALLAA